MRKLLECIPLFIIFYLFHSYFQGGLDFTKWTQEAKNSILFYWLGILIGKYLYEYTLKDLYKDLINKK